MFATDYSYRIGRDQQLGLLQGWVKALAPVLFPEPEGFSLDFHPIPYRGDPAGSTIITCRSAARPGRACSPSSPWNKPAAASATPTPTSPAPTQDGELMRFVEFWHGVAGSDPKWLYFDTKLVDYPELSRVNEREISFVTIRRRGAAILRRLEQQPASAWKGAVIDIPKRCHKHVRYIDETVRLRGYDGPIRQSPWPAWAASGRRCSSPTTSRRPRAS